MQPRRGRLVRPLLGVTRSQTRAHCRAHGLPFADDPSNDDPRFARARLRAEVLPVLRELNAQAEQTIAETARLLGDEADVLERAVDEAIDRLGHGALALAPLAAEPPGLARLVLRRLAEDAAGRAHPLSRQDADAVLGLARRGGGSASLDLGGGLRAVVEYGTLRFTVAADAGPPEPARLPVPGEARFGEWEVVARMGDAGEAVLSARALGHAATVRAWRDGDRMRPAGLGGTKTLQDLFTDRKVPRALRRSLPVLEARGEIAWVAGVAVAEGFGASAESPAGDRVALSARRRAG